MAERNGLERALKQAKISRKFQLMATRMLGLQANAAKRVFHDEQGEVSPEGERLLALLAMEARLNKHDFQGDPDRRLFDMGAQHMVRLLIDWIEADSGRLARAEQQLKDEMKGRQT